MLSKKTNRRCDLTVADFDYHVHQVVANFSVNGCGSRVNLLTHFLIGDEFFRYGNS